MSNTLSFPIRWAVHTPSNKPTQAQLCRAIKLIQPEEVSRIGKFYFRRDAHSSLIGRLLLRKCVQDSLGARNDEIRFERDGYNKPILVRPLSNNLSLNVSHQGDFVVLAADTEARIGVDVMKLEYSGGKDVNEFFRLMTQQFSGNEWTNIRKAKEEGEQVKAFMRHWTLKESYVKAVGLGLNLDLQRIEFETNGSLKPARPITSTLGKLDAAVLEWAFEEHFIDSEHVVAVAREKPLQPSDPVGAFQFLTFEDLVGSSDFLTPNLPEEHEDVLANYFEKPEMPGKRK